MKESKEGRLNTKDCLHALALLRRAKWFQARANSLQHCVLVIRVMRDFCLRNAAWSRLDFWVNCLIGLNSFEVPRRGLLTSLLQAVELIVERATYSAGTPLSPGDILRRVFETIAAGILLTTGDGGSPGKKAPALFI